MTTINYQTIKAAAAALHKVEAAVDTSNAGRAKATETLYLAVSGFFAANPALATGDGVAPLLPIIHGTKWTEMTAATQKSRKTELLTVATVSKVKGRIADCIAAAKSVERDFKGAFLKAVTFAKNNASADGAAIKAALTAKKAATVKTAGDHFENIMADLAAMLAVDRDAFLAIKAHAVGIQTYFNGQRALGKLRFARELAKKPETKAGTDFSAV